MKAVIISGGSEIVSAALVDEFREAGIPFAIVALGHGSLLRGILPGIPYGEIDWPPASPARAVKDLEALLRNWGATGDAPWPIFPTEDGGLRLLLEHWRVPNPLGTLSRSWKLRLGGLDKAELFEYLHAAGCGDLIAPTQVVTSLDEVSRALEALGDDCVIKPALKPLSMQLKGMTAKAFLTNHYPDKNALIQALASAWELSDRWVVQTRLHTTRGGEAVFWALRDAEGGFSGIAAMERWKQPRAGGTGCWVVTDHELSDVLSPHAKSIMRAIDYRGLCELPFLVDKEGRWRLLELNPRPWLQVGLAHRSGASMAMETARVLSGKPVRPMTSKDRVTWVNPERLLLAAWSGEYGARSGALARAVSAWRSADTIAIYGSSLPRIKLRWVLRMARKALYWRSP